MQALESLAAVCAVFVKAEEVLNLENSECDIVFEGFRAMDENNKAQKVQERAREKLHDAQQEAHAMAFMDLQERMSKMSDCQEVVDVKCQFLKDSGATKQRERPKMCKIKSKYATHSLSCGTTETENVMRYSTCGRRWT